MSQSSSISAAAVPRSVDLRGPTAAAAVIAALMLLVFWHFFARQVKFAILQPADWGHTLVIPAIAGYFVWMRRHELMRIGFRTTWMGFVPIVLGIGWYMTCVFGPRVLVHHNLYGLGVAATLFGIVLLFCGWRAMMILWFPLVYLVVFGQTVSDRFMEIITFKLQDLTARGSEFTMLMVGMDIERQGNTLYLYEDGASEPYPLNIAEACSGMRMLMAFLALGVAIAYTGLARFWQRAILVLLAVPTAIVVNIMRVDTLALLSRVDKDFTAGEFHTFVGLVWLIPAFLIYLGLVWIIRNLVVEPRSGGAADAGRSSGKASKADDGS